MPMIHTGANNIPNFDFNLCFSMLYFIYNYQKDHKKYVTVNFYIYSHPEHFYSIVVGDDGQSIKLRTSIPEYFFKCVRLEEMNEQDDFNEDILQY